MPEPGILEARIGNDDDSGRRVHRPGKGIKEGLLYLSILLIF